MDVISLSDEHEALFNLARLHLDEKRWLHVQRVFYYAMSLAENEDADRDVLIASVLLYQSVSYPNDDIRIVRASDDSAAFATNLLQSIESFPIEKIERVADVIKQNSLLGDAEHDSIESKILHDAIIFASFEKMYTRGQVNKENRGMLRMIVHEKSKRHLTGK